MSHYGIDVSRFQHPGDAPIDYTSAVRFLYHQGNGQPFAAVNSVSPFFGADIAGFRKAGASVMAYDFDDPGVAAPSEEAHFRTVAAGLPGALDVEQLNNLTFTQVAAQAGGWLNQPDERLSLLYSNLNYLANMPGAPFGHPVWFAGTALPPAAAVIWQYGVGAVPGIAGQVDLDRWVGTEAQYATFFGTAPPPPPLPVGDDMDNLVIIHDLTTLTWRLCNTATGHQVPLTGNQPAVNALSEAGVKTLAWPGADGFNP